MFLHEEHADMQRCAHEHVFALQMESSYCILLYLVDGAFVCGFVWLVGWEIGWLAGWLVGWLMG